MKKYVLFGCMDMNGDDTAEKSHPQSMVNENEFDEPTCSSDAENSSVVRAVGNNVNAT